MPWPKGYKACLATAPGDGNAVAATVTQTSLLTGSASPAVITLPAGWIQEVGQMFEIFASGRVSTPAATQGNLTFTVKVGSVNACVSPTFTSQASQTNITWELYWILTVRAVGSGTTTTLMHTGELASALVSATNLRNLIPATAPAVGTGFDSTASQTVDLQVTWSNNTAGNTITLHQYELTSAINY